MLSVGGVLEILFMDEWFFFMWMLEDQPYQKRLMPPKKVDNE